MPGAFGEGEEVTDRGTLRSQVARIILGARVRWLEEKAARVGREPVEVWRERMTVQFAINVLRAMKESPGATAGDLLSNIPFPCEAEVLSGVENDSDE